MQRFDPNMEDLIPLMVASIYSRLHLHDFLSLTELQTHFQCNRIGPFSVSFVEANFRFTKTMAGFLKPIGCFPDERGCVQKGL